MRRGEAVMVGATGSDETCCSGADYEDVVL
jgi:hypothetical protein